MRLVIIANHTSSLKFERLFEEIQLEVSLLHQFGIFKTNLGLTVMIQKVISLLAFINSRKQDCRLFYLNIPLYAMGSLLILITSSIYFLQTLRMFVVLRLTLIS